MKEEEDATRVLEVMRHATAWPKMYRNHFVADRDHADWETLMLAYSSGLMIRTTRPHVPGFVFIVTPIGEQFLHRFSHKEASNG